MGGKKITTTDSLDNKIPPQSIEAESAILGAMLLDENVVSEISEILDENLFYKQAHKIIFSSIIDLFHKRRNIDIITVSEEIKKRGMIEDIGGTVYLTHLVENTPSSANALSYAQIVKEKGVLRSLIGSANEMLTLCYNCDQDINSVLDKSEKLIFDISDKRTGSSYQHIKDIVKDSIEFIDTLYQKKSHVTGVASGFINFDKQTAGFQKGDLIIVAGRPSMGKSAFVSCIAENAAVEENIPVGIFSLEMSKQQMGQRFLCLQAKVDAHKVRTGFLSREDWPKITGAATRLSEAPIFVDDTPGITIFELRAKARRMKLRHNIGLLIVDYLQLARIPGKVESRQQEISEISRSLKALAKEIDVPVIVVSQLSRAVESRIDKRPQLSDLRESGAIEQDADLVVLLLREEYYTPETDKKGIAEAIIAKQRNGPVGSINLGFIKEYMKFVNLEMVHSE